MDTNLTARNQRASSELADTEAAHTATNLDMLRRGWGCMRTPLNATDDDLRFALKLSLYLRRQGTSNCDDLGWPVAVSR